MDGLIKKVAVSKKKRTLQSIRVIYKKACTKKIVSFRDTTVIIWLIMIESII